MKRKDVKIHGVYKSAVNLYIRNGINSCGGG